jgi:N-methylhydantoinase A
VADVRHDYVQTLNQRLDELAPRDIQAVFDRHEEQGRRLIAEEGIQVEGVQVRYQADIAYDGQVHEVRTVLPGAGADREAIRAAFEDAYRAQYGAALGQRPLRIRTLNTTVIGLRPLTGLLSPNGQGGSTLADALKGERPVYFKEGFRGCPVYERTLLPPETTLEGPAVIEQDDATTVLEPGMRLRSDALGNLIISAAESSP